VIRQILIELKRHAPFTSFGAITGIAMLLIIIFTNTFFQVSEISSVIFYILHPTHIILSAIVTTAIYRLHRPKCNFLWGILIGYVGSIGIATLSDSIIPYLGDIFLFLAVWLPCCLSDIIFPLLFVPATHAEIRNELTQTKN